MKGARSISNLPVASPNHGGVVVNTYSAGWLKRGFCWVYPAEIRGGQAPPGREVRIVAENGECLGAGIGDSGWIAVRRYRNDDGSVPEAVAFRVAAAFQRRRHLVATETAWRAVNAENDDLPGIRVDVWASHAGITLDSRSLDCLLPTLQTSIRSHLPSVAQIHIGYRRDPRETNIPSPKRVVESGEDVVVCEGEARFLVRPWLGKDAGLFTDMREVRAWLRPHWKQRRVLNLFAHTGAFSVAAALGGASEVETIDLAEPYLAWARANFAANALNPEKYSFLAEDSFRALDRIRRAARRFDTIVVDPPGFSHSAEGDWRGEKDWPRLAAGCMRVLEPGGWLIAASNLGTQSPREFGGALQQGAERAGRQLRIVHEATPPIDHLAALHFPESRYFKCWVLEVT